MSAGIGKNLQEWRPIDPDKDFNNNHKDWLDFQAGITAGIGTGLEGALYSGRGIANADSFNGVFNQLQASIGPVTGGVYIASDGAWTGVTITGGPGFGIMKVDWLYQHNGNVIDLDKSGSSIASRCLCATIRNRKFNVSISDAFVWYF